MESRASFRRHKNVKDVRQRKEERRKEENKLVFALSRSAENGKEPKSYVALSADFSPGGVRIMTPVPMSIGGKISLEIALSDVRKVIQAEGLIRWVKRLYQGDVFEAGIEFTKIAAEDCLLILRRAYKRQD